jgi:hypothetical protein
MGLLLLLLDWLSVIFTVSVQEAQVLLNQIL